MNIEADHRSFNGIELRSIEFVASRTVLDMSCDRLPALTIPPKDLPRSRHSTQSAVWGIVEPIDFAARNLPGFIERILHPFTSAAVIPPSKSGNAQVGRILVERAIVERTKRIPNMGGRYLNVILIPVGRTRSFAYYRKLSNP